MFKRKKKCEHRFILIGQGIKKVRGCNKCGKKLNCVGIDKGDNND